MNLAGSFAQGQIARPARNPKSSSKGELSPGLARSLTRERALNRRWVPTMSSPEKSDLVGSLKFLGCIEALPTIAALWNQQPLLLPYTQGLRAHSD
jgi:hypothetical protein